jgi:hypothetical protein
MEILEFSIRFQESGLNTEVADEFIFLSAAELGLKRGYTMFTPLESSVVISCSKQATVIGSGIFTSPTGGGVGTFSTQSSRVVSQTCQNSTSSKFIFFNDKNLLRNGVFIQRHSGPSASDRVSPLLPLYFGTTPNIRIPDVISIDGYIRSDSWPYQGWKVHYDSYAVSQKLREKHKVTGEINYKIISEVSSRENTLRTLEQKEP